MESLKSPLSASISLPSVDDVFRWGDPQLKTTTRLNLTVFDGLLVNNDNGWSKTVIQQSAHRVIGGAEILDNGVVFIPIALLDTGLKWASKWRR